MAGYLAVAGIWIVMYGIEIASNRAIAGAVERRDRRAAMGWLGATSLASAWVVALAVLIVGLAAGKDAGLAAALLALVLFTVHLGSRVLLQGGPAPGADLMADRLFNWLKGLPFLGKIRVFIAAWLIPSIAAPADLRQRREERGVQAPGRVQAPRLDPDPPRAPQPLDQPRGSLPVPGERADDLGDGLHRPSHAAQAQPHPGRGRGRLRRDQEQHHGHEPSLLLRDQVVPIPGDPVLLHRLLEPHRLPAIADE